MTDSVASAQWYIETLQEGINSQLEEAQRRARAISDQADELVEAIAHLMTGGKRLRALLSWWGWQGAGGDPKNPEILQAGIALELFQTAALIHDDILDRSDTRRGMPSVHRRFQQLHEANQWAQDPVHFGVSSAILAGDLALGLSEEVFGLAADATPFAAPARQAFNTMRFEVMTGQYMDIVAEADTKADQPELALKHARTVLLYKSAHYSTVWPFALGAILAGADEVTLNSFQQFSKPLGIAFQLRDDLLGVFGDPGITGKPTGDDLREGKRTELIAQALLNLPPDQGSILDQALSDPHLEQDRIPELLDLLISSGARDIIEKEIASQTELALSSLDSLDVSEPVHLGLTELTQQLLHRKN